MAGILLIETSTEVCSVAFAKNDELRFTKESKEGLKHSELLTVFIEELFSKNNLSISAIDAVAVSKGPGSYTGLRIGVSVAKGLCYALDKPLIAINSLDVLGKYAAQHVNEYSNFRPEDNILFCPMIDARRMEVYTALYNSLGERINQVSAEIVDENFIHEYLEKQLVLFLGNGAQKCKNTIKHKNAIFQGPVKTSAQFMQKIAQHKYNISEFENVAYFEPFYLKEFVATIPKNKIIK